jgi:hypothetical protein
MKVPEDWSLPVSCLREGPATASLADTLIYGLARLRGPPGRYVPLP